MDIAEALSESQTILMVIPSQAYSETVSKNLSQLSGKTLCYFTLNKTFQSIRDKLEGGGNGFEDTVFVDGVTRLIEDGPNQTEGCYFVSSPAALDELDEMVKKFVRHGFEFIVFDSVTSLLIYNPRDKVAKFLMNAVNEIKAGNTKAVFYVLGIKEHESLLQECSMFFDRVIDLGKAYSP
jgi:hypothetical protein